MASTDVSTPTGSAVSGVSVSTGKVDAADDASMTDAGQSWATNQHAGSRVQSTSGHTRTAARIDGNDATTLTVGPWSNGVPDLGARYEIYQTAIPFLILAGDIDAARTLWRTNAPRQFSGLLDGSGGWTWNNESQTYRSRNGHDIGDGDLKALSSTFAQQVEADIRAAAEEVAAGKLAVDAWQRRMAATIKDLYTCQGAIGVGGFANLTPDRVADIVGLPGQAPGTAFSIARLQGFAESIADESPIASSVGAITGRAGSYADASRGVFENLKRESHIGATSPNGRLLYQYERNILDDSADHCVPDPKQFTDGCPELTEAGWVPIGTMPLPGLRTCRQNCYCRMKYSLIGPALGTN